MKHVPGPWKPGYNDKYSAWVETDQGRWIATILRHLEDDKSDCPGPQQWANACLIAAAPDLLVACKGAIAALTQNKTHQADIDAAVTWLKRAVEAANNPHREKLAV